MFTRSIPLPRQIETDKASANFKKGVLTIILPKTAAAAEATKKIDVKTG
jgi:HSP20 family protein